MPRPIAATGAREIGSDPPMWWSEARRERERDDDAEASTSAAPMHTDTGPTLVPVASPPAFDAPHDEEPGDGKPRNRRLGDLLIESNLASQGQRAEALLQQNASGKRLGALLVELGALEERDLARMLSAQLGFPLTDLRHDDPAPKAIAQIPETIARTLPAIPIRIEGSTLLVAVADPSDQTVVEQLRTHAGMDVQVLIAPAGDIRRAIEASYH